MRKPIPSIESAQQFTQNTYNELDTTNGEDNIFSVKHDSNMHTVNVSRALDNSNVHNGSVSGLDLAGLGFGHDVSVIPEDQFDDENSGFDFIDNNQTKKQNIIGNVLGIEEDLDEHDESDLMALENDLIVAGAE